MTDFNQKSKKIEESWMKDIDKRDKKLNELESILDEKNSTIIRLKTGKVEKVDSRGEGSAYHAEMVKVLNKRLIKREERVRVL